MTRTSRPTFSGYLTASSAAIHPPSESPSTAGSVEAEPLPDVEQVEDRVVHPVDLFDALGLTESGEHRHHDVVRAGKIGQHVDDGLAARRM